MPPFTYMWTRLPFYLLGALVAACSATTTDGVAVDAVISEAAPLEAADFRSPIGRDFLRATNPILSDEAFETKWKASQASKLLFLRTYPGGYHRDLLQVAADRIPGNEGLCFGDLHPDNFGFLELDGETRYLFNDLDDSGYCFVATDAARYFTAIRLAFDDADLDERLLEQYVDTMKDPSRGKTIDAHFVPDLAHERKDRLDAAVTGDRIRIDDPEAMEPISAATRADLDRLMSSDPFFRDLELLDAVAVRRDEGGSGGLARYRILVQARGPVEKGYERTILELKESATPGVELGRYTMRLGTERLPVLKRDLWGTSTTKDYVAVTLGDRRFLVRDRLGKKSVVLADLSKSDLTALLEVQVSHLAVHHAKALEAVSKDELRSWLRGTSKTLAKRWGEAME